MGKDVEGERMSFDSIVFFFIVLFEGFEFFYCFGDGKFRCLGGI